MSAPGDLVWGRRKRMMAWIHHGIQIVVLLAVLVMLNLLAGKFPARYDLTSRRLFDEDVVMVVHPDHPLASREPLELSDLEGLPLLLPAPGTPFREEIDQAASKGGVVLTAKAELEGLRLIASLTFDGHGPSILPATAVPDRVAKDWKRITVSGLPRRQVGVAARRRALPSAPARAALSVLDDIIGAAVGTLPGLHPPGDS